MTKKETKILLRTTDSLLQSIDKFADSCESMSRNDVLNLLLKVGLRTLTKDPIGKGEKFVLYKIDDEDNHGL